MHVVFRSTEGDRELDVQLRNPEATLDDLLQAVLGARAPQSAAIGDRVVPGSCAIANSGLHEGAIVTAPPPRDGGDRAGAGTGLELVTVAGRDAARRFALAPGSSSIGRTPENAIALDDTTLSRCHCTIVLDAEGAITATDEGSANGTYVDGVAVEAGRATEVAPGCVIEAGAYAFTIRSVTSADRPVSLDLRRQVGATGTVPFNRPPRPARPPAPSPVKVPSAPGEPAKPHFSVASTLGPLVLAIVMIGITGQLGYALFMLLTPFIGVATYLESGRRAKQGGLQSRSDYQRDVETFERHVGEAGDAEWARLRDRSPDPAEVLRRAALPSVRLWERRSSHEDFLQLFAGLADLPWQPPLKEDADTLPPEAAEIAESSRLSVAPVGVDLSDGGIVGIAGDREAALATARSLLCQAAVHHGPADLTIGVFVDPGREPDWDWCKWLPHTRDVAGRGERWLSGRREHSDALLRRLGKGGGTGTTLVVIDSDVLTEGANAPARDLLNDGAAGRKRRHAHEPGPAVAGIVIATSTDRLPAACNTVIEVASSKGDAIVRRPEDGTQVSEVLLAGVSVATARGCACNLARFEDPELQQVGGGLPDGVRLLPLLDLEHVDAESVRRTWRRAGRDPGALAPIGVTEGGVFSLDLLRDGPHGLVGGTTGSGKSELLRSLVVALAVHADPAHLTFVLMDFKGGAAFDACSRLPHTVGMVSDLEAGLAERALEALEAEIQYRERLLRSVGADNLPEYLAVDRVEPLPRLLVVIDEFATLAKEHPDVLSSLVSVAQRGRTLGVHMILATQRPSGAVNDNIKTNTNLRIALRVQDAHDSTDVIGTPDAAQLSRLRPGRAYIRLGPGEIVPIQTALVTCVTNEGRDAAVDVAPFAFGPLPLDGQRPADGNAVADGATANKSDLVRLVDAIVAANAAEGLAPARRPWPEPLPARIDLAELAAGAAGADERRAVTALADDPRGQRQYPVGWDPDVGNLLLFGIPGSGTTTTLASVALSFATALSPDELEMYVLDYGAGDLGPLEGLPQVNSVILAGDRERQVRLIRHLRDELERRRSDTASGRRTIVLIDNLAALRAEFDDSDGLELVEVLTRVYADGREVGISFAVSADRISAVPSTWTAITTQKWLFALPDAYDYATMGVPRKDAPPPIAGRAVMAQNALQIQVGQPTPSLAGAVAAVAARYPGPARVKARIGVLPERVEFASLGAASDLSSEPWRIPLGIRESDLGVAELALYEGEHALVAGPARSGKSTTLLTIAQSLRAGAGPDVHLAGTGGRRSLLRDCPLLDRFAAAGGEATAMLAQLRTLTGPVVVLIDDAEDVEDADGAIAGLLSSAGPELHVIAAGRSDVLRTKYSHWTKAVAQAKTGVLLRPNVDNDRDLLGTALPRRAPVRMVDGRGYAVQNGEAALVQVGLAALSTSPSPHL
ncbi:MAG TPA: FtsK/SpoIIIE domain-containing protein [Solirubrobacteraceae bacterium]|nr:FtsK/SpoIIIE domain-containing protein [Solirubrobacteraceae bacterium]